MLQSKGNGFGFSSDDGSISRRDFLKKTSVAALGAATAVGTAFSHASAAENLTVNGLPATFLGRTGLKVTRISFGGVSTTEQAVLIKAIDRGINFVHTAPGYQGGRSMEAYGKVMKTHRDKVVLALKERPENLDKALKVLNTDYVDILLPPLHSLKRVNDPSIPENFEKVKKAGKAGYMGFSCHNSMAAVLSQSADLGYLDVALMSYSGADNPSFLTAAEKARKAGMGIMSMKGLPKHSGSNLSDKDLETFSSFCSSMVNRWHANTVLATMGNFQTLEAFLGILESKLSYNSQMLEDRYWAAQHGNYCAMCGNCNMFCEEGAEINRILRYRMYCKDYDGLSDYARTKYAALGLGSNPLEKMNIQVAESVCPRALPLERMVREAHSMLS